VDIRTERGQGTVEWVALLALVSLLVALLAGLAGLALPGAALARAIGSRLACAIELSGGCAPGASALVGAYGGELAKTIAAHAPELVYERGMRALPVDYRSCREDPCSLGPESGEVRSSFEGEPVTLFTHAVDCRGPGEPRPDADYDCSGARAGSLYLQYWAYYPGSDTRIYGDSGFHHDDWESEQLRLGAAGAQARASSHHGYNYVGGASNWLSDAGITHRSAWGPDRRRYYISGGSHAGHATESDPDPYRWTPGDAVRLVPLEPIAAARPDTGFAITPPWRKRVWTDPEYTGTD
jgi:hypothetical protein